MKFRVMYISVQGVQEAYLDADSWIDAVRNFQSQRSNAIMSISDCANTKSEITSKGRIKIVHYNIAGG